MGRVDVVRKVSAMLVGAFTRIEEYTGQAVPPVAHSVVASPSGRRFLLLASPLNAIRQAARKLSPFLDYYPLEKCQSRLTGILLAEKDAETAIQEVQARLSNRITEYLDSFESLSEWEVLFAVRGIDPARAAFTIGSCDFYLMDDSRFELWARRYSSGMYTPPAEAPILADWVEDETPIRGQVVATVRVHAADNDHAFSKARKRIEEAINVYSYAKLAIGASDGPFPEIGLTVGRLRRDHSFAMRIDSPAFTTNKAFKGLDGASYEMCCHAPGWAGWDSLIRSDLSARTELGIRLSTALQWIGQAALAPAASVRLVALVIALEASLIEEGESQGKKSKLSRRVSKLIASDDDEKELIASQVVTLYGIRSDCVHQGLVDVENDVIAAAVGIVARTFGALFDRHPIKTMTSLKQVVEHLEGHIPYSDRQRWISENAYLRYRETVDNPSKDRSLQNWLDAEREYNSQRLAPVEETKSDD